VHGAKVSLDFSQVLLLHSEVELFVGGGRQDEEELRGGVASRLKVDCVTIFYLGGCYQWYQLVLW
jgi:hypothetical protein